MNKSLRIIKVIMNKQKKTKYDNKKMMIIIMVKIK
jgi:hypothetical protein